MQCSCKRKPFVNTTGMPLEYSIPPRAAKVIPREVMNLIYLPFEMWQYTDYFP